MALRSDQIYGSDHGAKICGFEICYLRAMSPVSTLRVQILDYVPWEGKSNFSSKKNQIVKERP